MNRRFFRRALLSGLTALGIAVSFVRPAPNGILVAATTAGPPRATLRVGMWTLWHDRELELTPADAKKPTLIRSCPTCDGTALRTTATIHAEGNVISITTAGKTAHRNGIWLSGLVALTAHGDTEVLSNPVIIKARAGVLVIVVSLPVEDYVDLVVASESALDDSPESFKALAIVVRTFALHEAHGHADYDLCDSTHCQLLHWSGQGGTQGAKAREATLATAGETLWFHGQRALAYFGEECGGRTASPDEIWPRAKPALYLPSLRDEFCTRHGAREWASEIKRADLIAVLAAHGLVKPGWQNLTVARRGVSGRAVAVRIDNTEISAEDFRLAVGESLGWDKIPSTLFELSRQGDRFVFHGRGWGHGVGLCQKGSAEMAAEGHTQREILAQYFPGAEAADEATGRAWQNFGGDGFVLESLDVRDAEFLPALNRARAEAFLRSGLNAAHPFTVRAFPSTPAFRNATLEPGWVAAFDYGSWIGTQPLHTLASRQLLVGTLRHEFIHALVERETGWKAQLWLREGLVEVWSEDVASMAHASRPTLTLAATYAALTHAGNETESEAAHRAAAWYVSQLLAHYGRAQVLDWLRSGVPDDIVASLGQR